MKEGEGEGEGKVARGEVETEYSRLHGAVDCLSTKVDKLQSKFAAVLSETPPDTVPLSEEAPIRCELGGAIRSIRQRIEIITCQVDNIKRSCEL